MILPKLLLELFIICVAAIMLWQVFIVTLQILYCIGWVIVKVFKFFISLKQYI